MTVASQVKQTLANLKGIQSTLRIYSTQTQDDQSTAIYKEALETTETVINDLEQRVRVLEFQEPQYNI